MRGEENEENCNQRRFSGVAIVTGTAVFGGRSFTQLGRRDLDVDSEAGARILYARLRHASKDACGVGSLHELGSLKRFSKAKGCSEAMIEAAVKKIDSDALQEIHSS